MAINALTFGALQNNLITVFGGKQIRPNLTMYDMIKAYKFSLKRNLAKNRPVKNTIFNLGFENLILNMAKELKTLGENSKILIKPSNDPRSYRQNSDKLLEKDLNPKKLKTQLTKLKKISLKRK